LQACWKDVFPACLSQCGQSTGHTVTVLMLFAAPCLCSSDWASADSCLSINSIE
jgi:hypothetical protein